MIVETSADGGISVGFEMGVGAGTGFEYDPTAKRTTEDTMTVFTQATGRLGPIRGTVGFDWKNCEGDWADSPTFKPKVCAGPYCLDDQGNAKFRAGPSESLGQMLGQESGAGLQGKAGVRVMFSIFD